MVLLIGYMPMRARRRHVTLLCAAAVLWLSARPAAAQPSTRAPATPRAAVEQFWAAAWARDARRTAALIVPEALESFQRQQLLSLASFAEMSARRARQRADSAADDTGEIHAMHFDRLPDRLTEAQRALPVAGIAGIVRLGQLEALPPAEFFVRLMTRWDNVRGDSTAAAAESGPPVVLGEVADGDTVAHVVYRSRPSVDAASAAAQPAFSVPASQVMTTVRRGREGWRVVPDYFVFAVLAPPWAPSELEGPPGNN